MTLLALALAAAAATPPFDDAAAYRAIWSDVQLKAAIGSSDTQVTLDWYLGHDRDHPPRLAFRDLTCRSERDGPSCTFLLVRSPHPQAADPADRDEPGLLACQARFETFEDRWVVAHTPPPPGFTHPRTTMRCRIAG